MASTKISFNGYRRYKDNISEVLQWLVTTAQTSRVASDTLQGINKKKGTKKTTKANTKPSQDKIAVKLTIKDLQQLAKAVADVKGVKVPEVISVAAKDVSDFLFDCQTWFSAHGQKAGRVKVPTKEQRVIFDTISQNNDRAKMFLQAMKKVAETLSRPPEDEPRDTDEIDTEVSELTAAAVKLTLDTNSNKTTPDYELDASAQQEALAVYSFLKDCTNVQLFIAHIWQEFRDGLIGLQSASPLTNVAIAMIQEWSDELRAMMPQLRNSGTRNMHKILMDLVNSEYCYCENVPERRPLGTSGDDVTFEDVAIDTALSRRTYSDLSEAFTFKKGKSKYNPGNYPSDDKTFFRCISQLGALQYFDADLQIRLDVMRQKNDVELSARLREITKSDRKNNACTDVDAVRLDFATKLLEQQRRVKDDEESYKHRLWRYDYTYKAAALFLAGHRDSWVIYAAQIFRDTQARLEEHATEGLNMLHDQAQILTGQYKEYLQDAAMDHSGKRETQWKQEIEAQVTFLDKAILKSDFQNLVRKFEVTRDTDPGETDEFSLLENHPTLCGVILNEVRNKFQQISIDVASEQGHILAVAHLYNAARESGYLAKKTSWVVMDWFTERQGSDWIFGDAKPKLPADYMESICAALGLDPSKFEQDRAKAVKSRGASRRMRFLTHYLELDVKRETGGSGKIVGKTEAFHDLLAKMRAMASDFGEYDRSAATETLTPFRLAIEQDELGSNFNLLGLHMKCSHLLRQIRDECLKNAPNDYPVDIYDKPANLNMIVVELLRDLTGFKRQNKKMFLKATGLMSDLIEPDGEEELEQAKRVTQCMRILQDDGEDKNRKPGFDGSSPESEESEGSGHGPRSDGSDGEWDDSEEDVDANE